MPPATPGFNGQRLRPETAANEWMLYGLPRCGSYNARVELRVAAGDAAH